MKLRLGTGLPGLSGCRLVGLAFVLVAIGGRVAWAQDAAAPDPAATVGYIHKAWDELSRSMTDCHSLKDVKVTSDPVLYVPAELTAPEAVKGLTESCGVKVVALPKRITQLGDLMPEELAADKMTPGLLYLPNKYVVPGGRFNEMYGWDSYFIVLGLIADHREELAKGMVDNFFFEIEHYGAVLNANRTYFLTRSQPPFLTSMIRAVYEDPASFRDKASRMAWLETGYARATKDYETWMRPEHQAGHTGLARYYDFGEGPVPEMADDSTYYPDVIRWLVAHPAENHVFLLKGSAEPGTEEAARLKKTSCDVTKSTVCAKAEAEGYRLTRDFYEGDRAMRESGFDPSFRFEAFSGATHHYAPICLNSLLFRYERDMEHFAHVLGKVDDAHVWGERAKKRDVAMQRYLWSPKEGTFTDYDFMRARSSTYAYVTSLYPLWAGVATREQAAQIESKLKLFERPGGLAMSNTASGMQWDEPFGWAPTNWLAVAGLEAYQFKEDAKRIAAEFTGTIDRGFAKDATIREKYNVETGTSDVKVLAGYKTNAVGFGWTNGVYLKLTELK
ncbi:alpha,alpha-trehalase [Acidicapsa acidisoli]|uniref:alpha,alpha-trehalase n=1 Tax=Acidicapsa acidisoli TaxID=1615681 RepID=UPI0021E08C50|nr:alpha,alpha-trehalase [Acidicapsa acidisoli]